MFVTLEKIAQQDPKYADILLLENYAAFQNRYLPPSLPPSLSLPRIVLTLCFVCVVACMTWLMLCLL